MACGGRVYKGDTVTISVPFEVDDYSNLTITYTTTGDSKIVKTQEEVEIEDGFITYTFGPGELDLLPDGVIYYTIECEVLGVPNVDSTNTNLYLKTPAGYSGKTAEDYYQEGYEAGLEDCSGCTLVETSVGIPSSWTGTQSIVRPPQGYDGFSNVKIWDNGYGDKKYQSGYTAGLNDCSGSTPCDCSSAYTEGYHDGEVVGKTEGYTSGYTDGYNQGQAECPECDCTEAYQSGYTAGQEDCSGSSCNLEQGILYISDDGPWEIEPDEGYDGFTTMAVYDNGYGQGKYDQGFQSGYTEGYDDALYEKCNLTTALVIVPSGSSGMVSNVTPPSGYTGFGTVSVNATEYGQEMFGNGFQSGYTSGYTEGYNQGQANCPECDCSSAVTEAYQEGYTAGLNDCTGCPLQSASIRVDTIESTHTPAQGYVGFSSVFIDASEVYNQGYRDGGDGCWDTFNQGYQSGYTDGFQSGCTEGYQSGYTAGLNDCSGSTPCDCSSAVTEAYDNGHYLGYNEGKDSVIKSLLTENDTNLVIGYYYTSARTNCLITGEYHDSNIDYDGNSAFVSMSVNGGSWQPVEKYLELPAGWSQVRFSGCTTLLLGAFSHRFTPSQECYMDALKIVSLPTMVDGLSNTYTFHMNDGLRVIASSCGIMRGATNGADNINVVITHYTGNQREYNYFPSNGVLFIPEGSTADWASILPNWTHIEMF